MIDLSTLIAFGFRLDFDSYQIARSLEVKLHPLRTVVPRTPQQSPTCKSNKWWPHNFSPPFGLPSCCLCSENVTARVRCLITKLPAGKQKHCGHCQRWTSNFETSRQQPTLDLVSVGCVSGDT